LAHFSPVLKYESWSVGCLTLDFVVFFKMCSLGNKAQLAYNLTDYIFSSAFNLNIFYPVQPWMHSIAS